MRADVERRRRWLLRYAVLMLLLVMTTVALVYADERGAAKIVGVITAVVTGGYLMWVTARAAP
jgi:small-conductance mechanosensitive channel